jgi:hypothetical protein
VLKKPKPLALERHERRLKREKFEREEKAKVRRRDRKCRWPHCECQAMRARPEVHHVNRKGSGGDHGLRSTADQMLLLCYAKHQGPVSQHSGDCEIVMLTAAGTDGPCEFFEKGVSVGREIAVGVLEKV